MTKRHAAACFATLVCVAGLTACGSSNRSDSSRGATSNKSPVTVALVSFDLPGSSLLPEFETGANAAAKVINSEGGIGGRKLVIATCNSMLQPAADTECAHKTLKSHPVAMTGCDLAWGTGGLPIYAAAGVPSINCLNSTQDLTSKYSFGLNPSAVGQERAWARWACSQPNIKTAAAIVPNQPTYSSNIVPKVLKSVLGACGKTVQPVYYPLTAVDVAPYVTKALAAKPDFIDYSGIGAQVDSFYRAFHQSGWPASKTAMPDTDFTPTTTGRNLLNGAIALCQFGPWSATTPDTVTFTKALNGNAAKVRDPNVMWSYAEIMFIYKAAQKIGFAKFDAVSFEHWLGTVKAAPIPLSHPYINPGPTGATQIKQPYVRFERWENGKFVLMPVGRDGWIKGY